jgi:TolB-like protein
VIYQFGGFEIDTQNYRLSQNGKPIELEPKVFDLLGYLVINRDRLITRDELFDKIWPGQVVSDTSLSNQIKAARKAIGDNGKTQSSIKTVHGRGYQFIVPTDEIASHDSITDGLASEIVSAKLTSNGPSIAVLPFANLCSDTDKEYFCDGVTEDIRIGLSRFRELLVIARGSSYLLWEKSQDTTDVAEKLGVGYVLQGSVRTAENRVRITAQLIDGQTGTQIWGDTYDRVLDDLFEAQDEITQTIVAALVRRLEQAGRETALKKSKDDLTVYDLLLRARHRFRDWKGSREAGRVPARTYFRLVHCMKKPPTSILVAPRPIPGLPEPITANFYQTGQ